MDKDKATIEDVFFHIKRLTLALENFSKQVEKENLVYLQPPPVGKPTSQR